MEALVQFLMTGKYLTTHTHLLSMINHGTETKWYAETNMKQNMNKFNLISVIKTLFALE